VPILNGRDSSGNIIYLGPQTTRISRYLLVIFLARSYEVFRTGYGKEIDNSLSIFENSKKMKTLSERRKKSGLDIVLWLP
jgi:hypothetical protein